MSAWLGPWNEGFVRVAWDKFFDVPSQALGSTAAAGVDRLGPEQRRELSDSPNGNSDLPEECV